MKPETSWFTRMSRTISDYAGSPTAFTVAGIFILTWMISGPFFDFSDTWQLVVNTATTIVTFLMVFLIQNTQNRDSCAVQVKLEELIKRTSKADNSLMDLEEQEEHEIQAKKAAYAKLASDERAKMQAVPVTVPGNKPIIH